MKLRLRLFVAILVATLTLPAGGYALTRLGPIGVTAIAGQVLEIPVGLVSDDGICAVQFDLQFDPARLQLDAAVLSSPDATLRVDSSELSPGLRRVVLYSTTLSPMAGGYIIQLPATFALAGPSNVQLINARLISTQLASVPLFGTDLRPLVTSQPPTTLAVVPGERTVLAVQVNGIGPYTYQWSFNGTPISGATGPEFVLESPTGAQSGVYRVAITNAAGTTLSSEYNLAVGGVSASHAVAGAGYIPGGTVTITNTITYTGTITTLAWHVLLPAGWSYASGALAEGQIKPAPGTTSLLDWSWTTIPASPVTFTYTLNVPAAETGAKSIAALADFVQGGPLQQILAKPDPLVVAAITRHDADTDGNLRISLLELTRVIELYNTRNGTTRTGAYQVDPLGEDGFNPDPARLNSAVVTLARYHSADTDQNAKLSLLELTRVIELYNYRTGTTRTGQYHVQAGTEDGFAPGP